MLRGRSSSRFHKPPQPSTPTLRSPPTCRWPGPARRRRVAGPSVLWSAVLTEVPSPGTLREPLPGATEPAGCPFSGGWHGSPSSDPSACLRQMPLAATAAARATPRHVIHGAVTAAMTLIRTARIADVREPSLANLHHGFFRSLGNRLRGCQFDSPYSTDCGRCGWPPQPSAAMSALVLATAAIVRSQLPRAV